MIGGYFPGPHGFDSLIVGDYDGDLILRDLATVITCLGMRVNRPLPLNRTVKRGIRFGDKHLIKNAWAVGLGYKVLILKLRKTSRLFFLVLLFLVAASPGYTVLRGLTFSRKKLERPNPTSYVFSSSVAELRNAIDASLSSTHQEGRLYGSWMPSGLDFHGSTETEYDLHQNTISDIYYHWWKTPLEYSADFKLRITPVSDTNTRVDIQTSESKVRIGPNFGAHGGDSYEHVAPTTIEEYRILLRIGSALGERGMSPLELPQ